jgi:glycosyltransferase involved in cell wall biosynthesis
MHGNVLFRFKRHLEQYVPYLIAREIKWIVGKYLRGGTERMILSLKPDGASLGNVLLSYLVSPFLSKQGERILPSHSREWECLAIAQTFLDLGYCVDVIDWTNQVFVPQKDYAFFIDVRWNLQRLAPMLNGDCVKIMHIDLCHMLFNNAAEASRLLALQQRKHVTLPPRRFEMPNLAIEHADYATILGNEFTIGTFQFAGKSLFPVPIIPVSVLFPWQEEKDFTVCRKHYLWFGSGGFVRKGLDLVLDAFAEMPDYDLTVCGPIQEEKGFEAAYFKELYQTPNIHTIGWVDIYSPRFLDVINRCVGLLFPSASEGQCGGVVTCLHAGLIPVISYESGVDIDSFGVILKTSSLEEIKDSIRRVSSLSAEELEGMARKAWEYARAHHTREKFAEEYRKVIETIIATHGKEKISINKSLPAELKHGGERAGIEIITPR